MAGMLFLMTINGCTITEVSLKTGPDFGSGSLNFSPDEKTGARCWAPDDENKTELACSLSLIFCFLSSL